MNSVSQVTLLTAYKRFACLNVLMGLWHKHEGLHSSVERSLETELADRHAKIARMQQDYIFMLHAAGVDRDEFNVHIAESMTKGLLPTVLEHDGTTSAGYRTLLFVSVLPGGEIPAQAIRLKNYSIILLDGPILNTLGLPNVILGYEDKYSIEYGEAPITTTRMVDQFNISFINKMDAHIPDS